MSPVRVKPRLKTTKNKAGKTAGKTSSVLTESSPIISCTVNCPLEVQSSQLPLTQNQSLKDKTFSKSHRNNLQFSYLNQHKHSHPCEVKLVLDSGRKMSTSHKRKRSSSDDEIPATNEYVALDCEFVGAGSDAHSALGRCSVVDFDGRIVCDIYAKPDEPVTDYRTPWSGIRPRDLVNAVPFENARNIVKAAIKDRIVVGHAVHNDFRVLKIKHPFDQTRDTSRYKPLRRKAGLSMSSTPSLKKLTLNLLGKRIQIKEHSSVEDAKSTMDVFKIVRVDWEKEILRGHCVQKRVRWENNSQSEGSSTSSSGTSNDNDEDDDTFSYLSDIFWPSDLEQ